MTTNRKANSEINKNNRDRGSQKKETVKLKTFVDFYENFQEHFHTQKTRKLNNWKEMAKTEIKLRSVNKYFTAV